MEMVLGLRGLPAAEVGLIRSIVRLSSMLDADWTVSDSVDGDLLLFEGLAAASTAAVVVPVVRADESSPKSALHRPIRAEALVALLNTETSRRRAAAAAASPLPDEAVPPADTPSNAQVSGLDASAAAATARLKRWPSWNLLKDERAYLRMATMLSSASMTVDRLGELSGVRPEVCQAFIRHMDEHQMLAWTVPAAVPGADPAGAARAVVATSQALPEGRGRGVGGGFLNSLRRKLGIARSA